MRCPRCGNENPEQNRFCGMCGATMLASAPKPQPVPVPPAPAPPAPPLRTEPVPARTPEPVRTPAPLSDYDDEPSISGPSFLGLNSPPRSSVPNRRASLSIDPDTSRRSGSVDYLLEDVDEPRHSSAWKYILILIALALAVGFGYLRWKNQGFAWLTATKKPAVAATDAAPPDTNSASPSVTPDNQPAPVSQPPTAATPPPADSSTAPGANPANATGAAPDANSPASNPAVPAGKSPEAAAPDKASSSSSPARKDSSAADTGDTNSEDDASSQPAPAAKPREPAPKPRAATPAVAADPVAEARKYIYGRGASQDCERGLRLLKPAANQANPKAMVEMGALYSAGLCTPRDLPTAYRWFAVALRKDPENSSIQSDLQKLWSEMTQPERQLAIKLTQ